MSFKFFDLWEDVARILAVVKWMELKQIYSSRRIKWKCINRCPIDRIWMVHHDLKCIESDWSKMTGTKGGCKAKSATCDGSQLPATTCDCSTRKGDCLDCNDHAECKFCVTDGKSTFYSFLIVQWIQIAVMYRRWTILGFRVFYMQGWFVCLCKMAIKYIELYMLKYYT